MIFVTVGNFTGFPRLANAVADLKARGKIPDDVLLQVARMTNFTAQGCTVVPFFAPDDFERLIRDAAVIVCHGGNGTLIQALRAGRVPVVMPRQRRYGEHIDDHQMELSRALAEQGRVVLAMEVNELESAIAAARHRTQVPSPSAVRMLDLVAREIDDLLAERGFTQERS
ncbi:MAG: glycosyltransferase [Candidatus Binataceae bacterium]